MLWSVDELAMLSFQKLRVYQRSIEFLALTIDVIATLPKGTLISPISCFAQRSHNRAISPRVPVVEPLSIKRGSIRTLAVQRWKPQPRWTRCA